MLRNRSTHALPTEVKVIVVPAPRLVGVKMPVSAPAASATYTMILIWPSTPSANVKALPVAVEVNLVIICVMLTAPAPDKACAVPTVGPLNVCVPVNVCAASVRAIVAFVVGNVMVVASVPASVRLWLTAKVFPDPRVKVAGEPGVVIATLLRDVAEAAPNVGDTKVGVDNVGLVAKTTLPVPVAAVAPVPPRATLSVPVVPATIGMPVALVKRFVNVIFFVMLLCTSG